MTRTTQSHLEASFVLAWRVFGDGTPLYSEMRLWPGTKRRADFYLPAAQWGGVIIEIEGGVYSRGRHTRGSGYIRDAEKYNDAESRGFHVLRIPGPTLETDPESVIRLVRRTRARMRFRSGARRGVRGRRFAHLPLTIAIRRRTIRT